MKNNIRKIIKSKIPKTFRSAIQRCRGVSVYHHYYNDNKCIFIHIPKSAGQSVGESLFNDRRPGHWSIRDFEWEDYSKFISYKKFTFVRNPWDRLVSAYNYLINTSKYEKDVIFSKNVLSQYTDFEDFVLHGLRNPDVLAWVHFRTQVSFLKDSKNNINIDYIGRFERINDDFNELCDRFNIDPISSLGKHNASIHQDYRDYYNEETKKIVFDVYREDVELFGYEF